MFKGAFGSKLAITETLTRATPLMFTGLACALAFRSRLWNIGAEGQLYAGALAVAALGSGAIDAPPVVLIPLLMFAAALAGAAMLLGPALLKRYMNVDDVVTTLLLVVTGLVAGEATERGWRARDAEQHRVRQIDQLHRIAELASSASDAGAIWPTVRDTLCSELHLGRCWFEPADHQGFPFPELGHNGLVDRSKEHLRWRPEGFELPRNGVRLAVTAEGKELGRLVMLPDPGHGLSPTDRRMAVAVADQFGMVAARSGPLAPLW